MPEINEIVEELGFISDRLSTQVRMIAIGLLAVTWAIFVGESSFLRKLAEGLGKSLLIVSALSVLVLLVDFLQYVTGYVFVRRTLKAAEAQGLNKIEYDSESPLFKVRSIFFWTKQFILILTIALFLVVLVNYVCPS